VRWRTDATLAEEQYQIRKTSMLESAALFFMVVIAAITGSAAFER
jgi:hypothetical protein